MPLAQHPAEVSDDVQNLVGDLEALKCDTADYFAKLQARMLEVKKNTHWHRWAEKPARASFEVVSDWMIDAMINCLSEEIERAREEAGFDLVAELRKAARGN